MSEWKQLNKSVWQRVYADGTVGISRAFGTNFTGDVINGNGYLNSFPLGVGRNCRESESAVMEALDAIFGPQPELVERDDDWTFMRHGKKAATVDCSQSGEWYYRPLNGNFPEGLLATREIAEARAKAHVLTP